MTPHPKMSPATGRRGNEEPPRRPAADFVLVGGRLPEEQLKPRPGGTKLRRRSHGEVELQCVRQEEHAVVGRSRFEVGELYGVELLD